jgi:hypothetical protein
MATVAQILKDSGFSDDQIAAMEPKAITAFSSVLNSATAERERAQQERQANADFYDRQIVPSLTGWEEEKQRLDNERARVSAEAAFYKAQNESARAAGFIATDAPGYAQPRDNQGRYVSGVPGSTPGSPTFNVNEFAAKAGDGLAMIADVDWRHRQLFDGKPMPVSPSELIRQADARRLDPMSYATQTFGFDKREKELAEQRQKAHDDQIRKEATEQNDRKWAERVGSNPDLRRPQENARMAEIQRGVKSGTALPGAPGGRLSDPLMMGENERRQQTRAAIHSELLEQQS